MSFLSGHTKKVSVYGRRTEVRVVNRQSDFTSLETDENDPFGFFRPQARPKATYGKSRSSMLPSALYSKNADSDNDESIEDQPTTDQSGVYDTANSSLSFQSACSSASNSSPATPQLYKTSERSGQRKALFSKALNNKEQMQGKSEALSKPKKSIVKPNGNRALDATPKARRVLSNKDGMESPKTARKAVSVKASASTLPNESTPPPSQPTGRASRRAAQAARMAIQDYDFTDRDMTPRRPVPTKSYFEEKARQLAELALEEERERQQAERAASGTTDAVSRSSKITTNSTRNNSGKSMAARPRHTTALGSTLSSAIAVSDLSLSSANGVSNSSFENGGTSQSSFSLANASSDESGYASRKSMIAGAKSKAKPNKRVTRRIAATSDDEEDDETNAGQGSDDEGEQDPALRLAAQVADLAVSDEDDTAQRDAHLSSLLDSVSQTKLEAFSAVIQRLRSNTSSSRPAASRRRLEKIGEASYSEVFKFFKPSRPNSAGNDDQQEAIVLKIIPISKNIGSEQCDDLPFTSPATDVEREIRLMQLVARESSASDSFVCLRAAHIVRGAYPAALLQAWDRWDAKRRAKTGEGAENIRPHVLGRQQVFALLVMTDGGMDLESLKVKSWLQAASIFWQVVGGLGEMESRYEFEHRDLHWGNILVQSVERDPTSQAETIDGTTSWLLDPTVSGVKATIIDFTLSRACTSRGRARKADVLYYPFDDETLFDGSGDPQFEVYREMRSVSRGSWQSFCPATNVLWLRYLVHKLIDVKCKSHKIPKSSQAKRDADVQKEWRAYTLLHKAAAELDDATQKLMDDAIAVPGRKKGGIGGRKSLHPRASKSVLAPPVAGRARKGRATSAVTPLVLQQESEAKALTSAAQLMSLLDY